MSLVPVATSRQVAALIEQNRKAWEVVDAQAEAEQTGDADGDRVSVGPPGSNTGGSGSAGSSCAREGKEAEVVGSGKVTGT